LQVDSIKRAHSALPTQKTLLEGSKPAFRTSGLVVSSSRGSTFPPERTLEGTPRRDPRLHFSGKNPYTKNSPCPNRVARKNPPNHAPPRQFPTSGPNPWGHFSPARGGRGKRKKKGRGPPALPAITAIPKSALPAPGGPARKRRAGRGGKKSGHRARYES